MTPAETRLIFGDSFDGKYYNGNDYVSVTFRYAGNTSVDSSDWTDPDGYFVQGRDVLIYSASASGVNSNASYVTVDVTPQYSLFDFDTLYTNIGVTNAYTQNVSAYQTPFWTWFIDGQTVRFEGSSTIPASGQFPQVILRNSTSRKYIFCPVKYTNQSTVSGYSLRAGFYGASTYSSTLTVYIACPYITDGATGETGTFTTTSGGSGGDVNVNVDIDLEETNGLLDGILDVLGGLGDMLLGLFIPSEEFLEDWVEAMQQLLEDHLGGLYEAIDEITSSFSGFSSVTAKQSFHVDACNIPLAGATLTLGNWDVPLKTAALPQIFYDALAYLIDFLATAAFLNMCKRKIELFLNPDNEVV